MAGREHGGVGVESGIKGALVQAILVKGRWQRKFQSQLWKFPKGKSWLSRIWPGGFPCRATIVAILQVGDGRGTDNVAGGWCDGAVEGGGAVWGASLQEFLGMPQVQLRRWHSRVHQC